MSTRASSCQGRRFTSNDVAHLRCDCLSAFVQPQTNRNHGRLPRLFPGDRLGRPPRLLSLPDALEDLPLVRVVSKQTSMKLPAIAECSRWVAFQGIYHYLKYSTRGASHAGGRTEREREGRREEERNLEETEQRRVMREEERHTAKVIMTNGRLDGSFANDSI